MGGFDPPVAVIGAGPFGVSTAAYLRSCGVEFRIFGSPMNRCWTQMLAGMFLKSEGFASNLADPTGRYTLQQFCDEAGLPYGSAPVSLETFTRYALSFQQHLVPMVEDVLVTMLDGQSNRFELRLATGEEVRTTKVVVATGLSHAAYIPPELAKLPAELLSHYFTGIASAYDFGPVMRFLCGTHYAARCISGDIASEQRRSRSSVSVGLTPARNRTAC
jgi:cation diffusion facilitator CzcD-associated flavoprotein CzcO